MIINCDNCGEPAMPSDSKCWHCGAPLPGREPDKDETIRVANSWKEGANPRLVLIYGLITAIVIIGALALMAYLGRLPKLQVGVGTRVPESWQAVTPVNMSFYVNLPGDWFLLDASDKDQRQQLQELVSREPVFEIAGRPLGASLDDWRITFLGYQGSLGGQLPPLLFVIGESDRLAGLSYQEAMGYLAETGYQVKEVFQVDNFDKSHLSIYVRLTLDEDEENWLVCRQQYIRHQLEGILVSFCAPEAIYPGQEEKIVNILESFQYFPR